MLQPSRELGKAARAFAARRTAERTCRSTATKVESAGPRGVRGTLRCHLGEFPAFVRTMLEARGLRAEVVAMRAIQYIEVAPFTKG